MLNEYTIQRPVRSARKKREANDDCSPLFSRSLTRHQFHRSNLEFNFILQIEHEALR